MLRLRPRFTALLAVLVTLFSAATVSAEDAFFFPAAADIQFDDESQIPEKAEGYNYWTLWRVQDKVMAMQPYVELAGDGEAFVDLRGRSPWQYPYHTGVKDLKLAVRLPEPGDVSGWLVVPKPDYSGMARLKFRVDGKLANVAAQNEFYAIKEAHYQHLLDRGVAGGAWFRHEMRLARGERGATDEPQVQQFNRFTNRDGVDETFDLFSGGRAISENLQLDRELLLRGEDESETVDIATIDGITIAEVKWQELLGNAKPELDPLAAYIPHDQHGLFFPDFKALLAVMDEANGFGTQILNVLEPRTEDAKTSERYRTQLCLETSGLSRILGPQVIASVAMTGGDPYLRTGSDVAVLFEAKNAGALVGFIRTKQASAKSEHEGTKELAGEINGVKYVGVRSPDRSVCSYLATIDDKIVVVANSQPQLERIIATARNKAPSMASLDEYKFFRHRYPRGADHESGFVMLTDAAIRRWCSPEWRIGNSRRTRAAAVLAELQAENLPEFVSEAFPEPIEYPRTVSGMGQITLAPQGVESRVYGNLEFLTPIAELSLDKVTPSEAQGYENWRRGYESNWNGVFDPIGIQFSITPEKLAADMTVMPLIGGTEYRDIIAVAGKAKILPGHGDPHPEALMHMALALDVESKEEPLSWLIEGLTREVKIDDPLGWFDGSMAVYVDADPMLPEFASAADPEAFWRERGYYFPVGVFFQSKDQEKLQRFITALQKRLDEFDAMWLQRERKEHNGAEYFALTLPFSSPPGHVYYAVSPHGLTLTLSDKVMLRALDRASSASRERERAESASSSPDRDRKGADSSVPAAWLGDHFAVQLGPDGVQAVERIFSSDYRALLQARAWGNIPILNEWKRQFPDQDPLKLHEHYWGVSLTCPGGGRYVWNDECRTMESTTFGHPAQPKSPDVNSAAFLGFGSLNAGVTFENNGLRAKAELKRGK